MVTSVCRSCGARIIWAETAEGRAMPLDAEPSNAGNVILKPNGVCVVATPDTLILIMEALGLDAPGLDRLRHKSHFATCPNAAAHRKGKGRQ